MPGWVEFFGCWFHLLLHLHGISHPRLDPFGPGAWWVNSTGSHAADGRPSVRTRSSSALELGQELGKEVVLELPVLPRRSVGSGAGQRGEQGPMCLSPAPLARRVLLPGRWHQRRPPSIATTFEVAFSGGHCQVFLVLLRSLVGRSGRLMALGDFPRFGELA